MSRVFLERPSQRRRDEFLELARASREFHRPWVTAPTTAESYADFLKHYRKASALPHFVCDSESGNLVGVANLSEVVRGMLQSGYLGFYAFESTARSGYMTEGIGLVLDAAFGDAGLHRVEANVQPGNGPSKGLVAKLGFRMEGFSPRYLKIRGRWRDHERWAILREDWRRR